jgi:hypothetical protein
LLLKSTRTHRFWQSFVSDELTCRSGAQFQRPRPVVLCAAWWRGPPTLVASAAAGLPFALAAVCLPSTRSRREYRVLGRHPVLVKVSTLGGGGRQHQLAWTADKFGHEVCVVPGNAGIRWLRPGRAVPAPRWGSVAFIAAGIFLVSPTPHRG